MFVRKIARPLLVLASLITVTSLSCSAVSSLPNPFASATPTVSDTSTPTATPSPAPTATPTPTATAAPTGVVINRIQGGGAQLLDYDGGYTIDFPAEWIVSKVDAGDIQQAIQNLGESNPDLGAVVKAAQEATPGTFRIIGFDKNLAHSSAGYVTNLNVGIFQDSLALKAPLDFIVQASIEAMKKQLPTLKIKQLDTKTNAHGVVVAAAESQLPMNLPGGQLTIYQRQLYFQTKTAFVVITFSTPLATANAAIPSFDAIRDGIQLMGE